MARSLRQEYIARFCAILQSDKGKPYKYPTLVRFYDDHPDTIFWGVGGLTRWGFNPETMTVVEEYGTFSDHDIDAIDYIERKYYAKYQPIPASSYELSEGYISPEGVFYDCPYGGHTELAHHIAHSFFPDMEDAEKFIQKNWIRVYKQMTLLVQDGNPTTAQLETLKKILDANPDKDQFRRARRDYLDLRDIPFEPI